MCLQVSVPSRCLILPQSAVASRLIHHAVSILAKITWHTIFTIVAFEKEVTYLEIHCVYKWDLTVSSHALFAETTHTALIFQVGLQGVFYKGSLWCLISVVQDKQDKTMRVLTDDVQ